MRWKSLRIFARQPLDDRVGRLPDARIKDLDLARLGFVRNGRAAAIEDHHDLRPAPILKVAQLPDQRLAGERGAAFVEKPQFRPGENNAVTVDQKILRPHLGTIEWRTGSNQPGRFRRALLGCGNSSRLFGAGFRRRPARSLGRRTFALDIRFSTLPLDCDPVLLTHEAVAIGRKGQRRNLES